MADTESSELVYGNCEGPDSMYVKLISLDGHEFIIKRQYAVISGYIKRELECEGRSDSQRNEVAFKEIESLVLQKICHFLIMQGKYSKSTEKIKIRDIGIDPKIAVPLLKAASFLDC